MLTVIEVKSGIYAARCGVIRFLLHAKQANFLYLVHLGDFPNGFQ